MSMDDQLSLMDQSVRRIECVNSIFFVKCNIMFGNANR